MVYNVSCTKLQEQLTSLIDPTNQMVAMYKDGLLSSTSVLYLFGIGSCTPQT